MTRSTRSSVSPATRTAKDFLVVVRATESVTRSMERDRGFKDKLKAAGESVTQYVEMAPERLAVEVKDFLGKLEGILGGLPQKVGEFALEELELSAEITAEGEVAFLGTGAKLGGTGGLKFTFKRKQSTG